MKLYVGIDPGKDGGIVSVDENKKVIHKFFIPKIKTSVDLRKLNDYLKEFSEMCFIVMEQVHAIFGSSAKSTFNFGQIYGQLEGMIIANNFNYQLTQPKIWQKEIFQGITEIRKPPKVNKKGKIVKGRIDTKAMAELAYKRLFYDIDLYITEKGNKSKNVHGGLCDALLIAEFARRRNL